MQLNGLELLVLIPLVDFLLYLFEIQYYGSNGMVTLRELILTRNRQRKELLTLLFQLVFYEVDDAADHIKEVCYIFSN